MSAFPISGEPSERTGIVPDTGKAAVNTMGGGTRGTTLFDRIYFVITMIDENLTVAERDSIYSHHDLDPDSEHTRTIDGDSYTFKYLNRPRTIGFHGQYRTVQSVVRGYLT